MPRDSRATSPTILPALEPRVGDERVVRRFAWFPVFVDDGYGIAWLCHYEARQRFTEADSEPWGSLDPTWVTVDRRR